VLLHRAQRHKDDTNMNTGNAKICHMIAVRVALDTPLHTMRIMVTNQQCAPRGNTARTLRTARSVALVANDYAVTWKTL
jgi:hypothetical protein